LKITNPNNPRFVGELHDSIAQYIMELSDSILASDSPAERAIYKLLDYVAHAMPMDGPPTEEARANGLKPRQIRYFLRSYELPENASEKTRAEFGFIDQARFTFERLDSNYHLVGHEPKGWVSEQKMNKHLQNLMRIKAIERLDGPRYRLVQGQYYTPGMPRYYKRMMEKIPVEQMVPHMGEVRTNLVYLRVRDRLNAKGPRVRGRPNSIDAAAKRERLRRLDAFEKELLAECDAFGVRVQKLYEKHMGELDLEETQYMIGFREFLRVTSEGGMEYMHREKARDPRGWAKRFRIEEADFNEWKKFIHEYWSTMPVLVIDPRPRPDQVPPPLSGCALSERDRSK
jgi:hypothetical protein